MRKHNSVYITVLKELAITRQGIPLFLKYLSSLSQVWRHLAEISGFPLTQRSRASSWLSLNDFIPWQLLAVKPSHQGSNRRWQHMFPVSQIFTNKLPVLDRSWQSCWWRIVASESICRHSLNQISGHDKHEQQRGLHFANSAENSVELLKSVQIPVGAF